MRLYGALTDAKSLGYLTIRQTVLPAHHEHLAPLQRHVVYHFTYLLNQLLVFHLTLRVSVTAHLVMAHARDKILHFRVKLLEKAVEDFLSSCARALASMLSSLSNIISNRLYRHVNLTLPAKPQLINACIDKTNP